jgi:hypothetical protein
MDHVASRTRCYARHQFAHDSNENAAIHSEYLRISAFVGTKIEDLGRFAEEQDCPCAESRTPEDQIRQPPTLPFSLSRRPAGYSTM